MVSLNVAYCRVRNVQGVFLVCEFVCQQQPLIDQWIPCVVWTNCEKKSSDVKLATDRNVQEATRGQDQSQLHEQEQQVCLAYMEV